MKKRSQKRDKTTGERQSRRVSDLDRLARSLGFKSWSELGTKAKNGEYILPPWKK